MSIPVLLPRWLLQASTPPRPPPRLFVAEDEVEMRQVLAEHLLGEGYRVVPIGSGVSLLDELRRARSTAEPPDLLLTDVAMPGLSGLQALRTMREWGWRTPVVLLTGFGDDDTLDEAHELGVNAVCQKPMDLDHLSLVIQHCLPRH